MNNKIFYESAFDINWIQKKGDKYMVTGIDVYNKRFKLTYDSWYMAEGINLYRGSKWLLRDNKRYLISRVYN